MQVTEIGAVLRQRDIIFTPRKIQNAVVRFAAQAHRVYCGYGMTRLPQQIHEQIRLRIFIY